ncbi:MAG: cyclic nucleotide-binding domain-containing protein [Limisphaerales bacterium]
MENSQGFSGYKIWAVDGVVYGPVELSTLIEWVRDERVLPETWVFVESADVWQRAAQVTELASQFTNGVSSSASQPIPGYTLGALRRIKILAGLSDQQIERFAQLMEEQMVRQWHEVFRQGECGNAMYFVLEGELRARIMVDGKETILSTLAPGDFFGEMSLFDSVPRSADVLANKDSVLLKVSLENFQKLLSRAPELAAPILFEIGKTLVARTRQDNKRYKESLNLARAMGL